jgi:EmrB/QacA subfamily drug resistance transporter
MWVLSLGLFTAGSALCAVSWSAGSLIVFRILQGLGGGMIMPIGQTIMARAAGPQRMGRVMSLIGIPTLIAPILGPVLGGLIIDNISWRWIFLVNVPIGALAIVLSLRFLSPGERQDAGRLDLVGALLLSPGLAFAVYGLSEAGGGSGFGNATVLACLLIGVALIAGFVVHALRADRPLLDMHLFRDRGFAVANVTTFVFGAALYAAMFLLPLYYQLVRGDSALDAGLLMAPQGIGAMLTMPLAGRLTDRIGARRVVPFGMALFLIGTISYTQLGPSTSYVVLALALFVRGLGMGGTMMPTMSAAYMNLTHSAVARASTTINIVMRVGGSLGTALVAVVLQRQIASRLPGMSNVLSSPSSPGHRLPDSVAHSLSAAFGASFWAVLAVNAVGLGACFLLPKRRPEAGTDFDDPAEAASIAGVAQTAES